MSKEFFMEILHKIGKLKSSHTFKLKILMDWSAKWININNSTIMISHLLLEVQENK